MRGFHFISGLPRSGSTLTAAILRQNPDMHAGMSSPVGALFENIVAQVSAGSELAPMVDEAQRARLLRGLFESYYADRPERVIFDTNRGWTAQLPALTAPVSRRQADLLRPRRRLGDGQPRAAVPRPGFREHPAVRQRRRAGERLHPAGGARRTEPPGRPRLAGAARGLLRRGGRAALDPRLRHPDHPAARGLRARPRVPRPAALRLRLRARRLRRPGLRRRPRPRRAAPGAAEGGAAATPDRAAARPLQALLGHGLLAQPDRQPRLPHRGRPRELRSIRSIRFRRPTSPRNRKHRRPRWPSIS